jgi:DNA polymerase phi
MLRLLGQRASEAIKKDDEEDSEVEMDEDGDGSASEDAAGSGSDEDAADQQQEDSEDSSSEDEEEGAAAVAAGNKQQKQQPATSDDEDDASDDNMDDDAMMRLDAQLGAAVRSMLAGRGGSAKDRAAAMLGLQLRVAALLEEWLKKVRSYPIFPSMYGLSSVMLYVGRVVFVRRWCVCCGWVRCWQSDAIVSGCM